MGVEWVEFDNGRIRLHCGDALDAIDSLDEQSIDAIVFDPPYCAGAISEAQRTRANGQGLRSETIRRFGWFVGDNMGTAGLSWLLRAVAVESCRIVKPTGSMVVFCDWRMQAALQPAIESAGLRYQGLIVWNKRSMGLGTGFRNQHELALHFTYGSPVYHDMGTSNVIDCDRVSADEREHQTQKPTLLMERIIGVVAPGDGVVFDPFMGRASTGIAAIRLGRQFVGVDRDFGHFNGSIDRIRTELAQPRLFPVVGPQEKQSELFGESA